MKRELTETYLITSSVGETVRAFIPNPLPPKPDLQMDRGIQELHDRALLTLGKLDGAASFLPETSLFLYQYIRKEAVLSSQIEGTQSSLSDLLLYEMNDMPGAPLDDVREVSNYVAALEHGLARLRDGFPLSLRLFKEIHGVLLREGRGSDRQPGEFRRSQNWIGGMRPGQAIFVPPPAEKVMECMGELEYFLHGKRGWQSPLIRAGLAHVQFETIHPFLDGNGRLGRMLITLLLIHDRIITEPLLYLSLYFKTHRQEYYDLLQKVRLEGDWEAWIRFFLEAIHTTAEQGVNMAQHLHTLAREDRKRIESLGRRAGSVLRVHHKLLSHPIVSIPWLCRQTGLVPNTVAKSLSALKELGFVTEHQMRKRNRIFIYRKCLEILSEGTEIL